MPLPFFRVIVSDVLLPPCVRFIHSSTASARSGFACCSKANESLYMTAAIVSDGLQRRNSAKAGSSLPAARKSEPFLKASDVIFRVFTTSDAQSMPTPMNINIGRPRSMRTCKPISNRASKSNSIRRPVTVKTAISLRFRSGINRIATIAKSTGNRNSIALTHDGAIIMRLFSISPSKAAMISEVVTNCPEGSTEAALMMAGSESTNTVDPRKNSLPDAPSRSATSMRGTSP